MDSSSVTPPDKGATGGLDQSDHKIVMTWTEGVINKDTISLRIELKKGVEVGLLVDGKYFGSFEWADQDAGVRVIPAEDPEEVPLSAPLHPSS